MAREMVIFYPNPIDDKATFQILNIFQREEVKETMINKVIIRAKSALRRLKSKKGQTLVEYALILAFISVVAISVLIALGNQVKSVFTTITSQLAVASSSH